MGPRILVAVGDRAIAELVAAVLEDDGRDVLRADAGTPTRDAVRREGYDLLVTADLAARIDAVCSSATCATTPASPCRSSSSPRPGRGPCPRTAPSSPSPSTPTT